MPQNLMGFATSEGLDAQAWQALEDEYQEKSGDRVAALLRGILNPSAKQREDAQ